MYKEQKFISLLNHFIIIASDMRDSFDDLPQSEQEKMPDFPQITDIDNFILEVGKYRNLARKLLYER